MIKNERDQSFIFESKIKDHMVPDLKLKTKKNFFLLILYHFIRLVLVYNALVLLLCSSIFNSLIYGIWNYGTYAYIIYIYSDLWEFNYCQRMW